MGWHGGSYVLPDKIIGPNKNIYSSLEELDSDVIAKYRARNSLVEWQKHVGKLCVNNSRLMFAVSLAFTGPILRFAQGVRSGGFQIYGDPETGKSTAAMVAGSVWGCHLQPDNGFIETWNTTANKVEITALAHNEGLLILDETRKAANTDGKRIEVVKEVVMRLAEQREKNRLPNAQAVRSWRCYFLSTSNYSLGELATKGRAVVDDADRGRLVDIPLPNGGHGIYEHLHGWLNGEDLTDHLKKQCRIYYGDAIREFIARLRKRKSAGIRKFVKVARQRYLNDLRNHPKPAAPLQRASARFATVYAAGSLAISLGVLDWDRNELRRAILSCQLDGLAPEEDKIMSAIDHKLFLYLKKHSQRFIDLTKGWLDPQVHQFGSSLVYKAKHRGNFYWYLTAETLKSIIGTGSDARRYKQTLADDGRLDVSSGGQGGQRFVVERRIFKGKGKAGLKWVHAIKFPVHVKTTA